MGCYLRLNIGILYINDFLYQYMGICFKLFQNFSEERKCLRPDNLMKLEHAPPLAPVSISLYHNRSYCFKKFTQYFQYSKEMCMVQSNQLLSMMSCTCLI